MALLTREQILKKDDRAWQDVLIPAWGGKVRVRSLSGAERDAFEDSILGERKKDGSRDVVLNNLRAKLVALTAVDKDGTPLFSKDDVVELGKKNAAALDRLYAAAQKLSGIGPGDVEEMVKNSAPGQDDVSS